MEVIKRRDGIKYREKIYIAGKEFKSPVFSKKSEANAWKKMMQENRQKYLATGLLPEEEQRRKMTFKEFAYDWLNTKVKPRSTRRTYDRYECNVRVHLVPLFGDVPLKDIRAKHADELLLKLRERQDRSPTGINLILKVMKQILIEANNQNLISKYPLKNYKGVKVPKRKDVFLTKDEINRLLESNKDCPYYPLYVVALNTGMRKGELAGLCWDRVNFETGQIEITRVKDEYGLRDETKTGDGHRYIPMNTQVRDILVKLYENKKHPEFVFTDSRNRPYNPGQSYDHFKRAQQKANFDRQIRFHDMRHTFASHFMMNGGNIYDLQKILGHGRLEVTQRYAHLAPEHLSKAITLVGFS